MSRPPRSVQRGHRQRLGLGRTAPVCIVAVSTALVALALWAAAISRGRTVSQDGFATAFGATIPPRLVDLAGPAMDAWMAAPRDPDAVVEVGVRLHGNAEFELAIAAYEHAIDLGTGDPRVAYLLGLAHLERGRADLAIEPLERVVATMPDYAAVHIRLGDALRDVGRFDDACRAYRIPLTRRPGDVDALVGMGAAHRQAGRLADATGFLERALAVDDEHAAAHQLLGLTLAAAGEQGRAAAHLGRAAAASRLDGRVMDDPWLADVQSHAIGEAAMLDIAERLIAAGRTEGALSQLERIEARHGRSAKVERARGRALLEARQLQRAVSAFVRATDLDPTDAEAHAALAALLLDYADAEDAARHARMALQYDPEHPQAALVSASLAGRDGRHADAVALLVPLVERRPESFLAHLRLGEAHIGMQQPAPAVPALEAALRLQPRHVRARVLLAEALAALGREDEARAVLAAVPEGVPRNEIDSALGALDGGTTP